MPAARPLTAIGSTFGDWTVTGDFVRIRIGAKSVRAYPVRCVCGHESVKAAMNLYSGATCGCGCRRIEKLRQSKITHGASDTRLYGIWRQMHRRCEVRKQKQYQWYGARGISVDAVWKELQPFWEWAMSHGYREDLTLDRIDSNGNYSPDNCRWVTRREQSNNIRTNLRVTYLGETKTLADWARDPRISVSYDAIATRIQRGWDPIAALTHQAMSHRERGLAGVLAKHQRKGQ